MDTESKRELLSFDDARTDLVWMPFAARRALDAGGIRLSLEDWQRLPLPLRWQLVELGSARAVAPESVHALLRDQEVAPSSIEPWFEPEQLPSLLCALATWGPALESAWPDLGGLERYALVKIAETTKHTTEERSARLEKACRALLGPNTGRLTHLNSRGEAQLVDVTRKLASERRAVAGGSIRMRAETLRLLQEGRTPKGDVLATARLAGILAAKRTPEWIPLCHAVALTAVEVSLVLDSELPGVTIEATARAYDRTGVEMEALVAVSAAGLTLYDMLKAVDREMVVGEIRLLAKSGGRSGEFLRGSGP